MENHSGMADVDIGKLLIHPLETSGNHTSSHMAAKQEEWAKGMRIWPCKVFLFILASDFFTFCKKICRPSGLTSPLKGSMLWIFIARKRSIALTGFEPMNPESNCKHTPLHHGGQLGHDDTIRPLFLMKKEKYAKN
jgi:hypothetical protein